ncbi:MAG: LmeA family phospholipid-binding protein [Prochloraceae cyanobacterium]
MLSSFVDFEPNQSTDWGENLLNTVAGKAIRHLFTRTESVEVKVRCHPSTKLLQGSVDINQAFQAELVTRRLKNLSLPTLEELSAGQTVSFTSVELQLLPHNRIKLFAKANFANGSVPITMSCTLAVVKRRRIAFQEIQFEPETIPETQREISQRLTLILGEVFNNMVDLDRFDLDGVTMRLNRLETQGKMLWLSVSAQIERFPRSR